MWLERVCVATIANLNDPSAPPPPETQIIMEDPQSVAQAVWDILRNGKPGGGLCTSKL